jgi:EmrB/QacA subfamily drug resistance transporter
VTLERRRQLTLAATIIGSSLAFIDATVVIVALPAIDADLDLGLAGQQWVFLSYSLALAALYLAGGGVGDRYGRRVTFIWGAAAFAATSLIAGIAPNEGVLLLARVLQGVAGAFLTTNSLALLRAVYADEAGRAVGLWTAFTSVATVAGPPAGGAIVEWISWRWIFVINLPFAGVAVLLAQLGRCDERKQLRTGRLDLPGAALAAIGFGALTYGIVQGSEHGFGDVWWAFPLSAAALVAFFVVERRVAQPMLPFDLFRRRNFAAANLETFFVYAGLYGVFIYLTLYIQFLGFSAFEAGLILTIPSVALITLAARFGMLADRQGPRLWLTLGPVLIGAGALISALVRERDDFWIYGVASLLVFSLGLAMMVAPITATALKSAPSEFSGIASGVNSTVSRLGSLLAIAFIGLVVQIVFAHDEATPLAVDQTSPVLREASVDAFTAGMILAAGLAFAGAAVGALWVSNEDARPAEVAPATAAGS